MRNSIFNYLTLAIVLIGWPFLVYKYLQEHPVLTTFSYVGIFLIIVSIIAFTMARFSLGDAFQASSKANKLVTTGIYKRLRHPIYYSGLGLVLGLILIIGQFYLSILWVLGFIMQSRRIRKEEKVLTEAFGKEYTDYKKSTWL